MSADTTSRAPAPAVRRPALARCVARGATDFADTVWGRAPLLSRAADLPAPFTDLLSAEAVDELVSSRGLRSPFLRVARAGTTLAAREFTGPGGVGAAIGDQVSDDRLTALFSDGATLVLQALHRTWPPVIRFAQQLASELGHPVQVNAYVTPAQSQGFSDHYDVHDVFVLQVEGEKRWLIRPPVHEAPLRDEPWTGRSADVRRSAADPPLLDVVLRPGDALYLPRGYLHAATALGGVSTHLTVGVHTWTRHALAEQLLGEVLADLATDERIRASLALGTDVGSVGALAPDLDLVVERVRAALDRVDPAAVAEAMAGRSRAAGRAAPVAPLEQARAAADLHDGTRVVLRRHLEARLVRTPSGAVLRSRAGQVDLEPAEVPAVEMLLRGDPVDVGALPHPAGDGASLVRRLLAAAVVVPA